MIKYRAASSAVHAVDTSLVSQPLHALDVDKDLWQVLDLCTDTELEALFAVLHSRSPFSPLVKNMLVEKEPALLQQRGRVSIMHKIESRFRFLAADPDALLKGTRPGYRETLLTIRDRLEVGCSSNLATNDLETELFVHIMEHCLEYVSGEGDADPREAAAVALAYEGDGMSSSQSSQPPSRSAVAMSWVGRLTAPFRFGLTELLPSLVQLGGALTVSSVGRQTVQKLASNLVCSHVRYRAALTAAGGAVAGWSKSAVLEAAQHGVIQATARYSALQGALAFLGPLMWGWLALDLAMKSIGTDYARVIRAVFLLAQVRLVRTQGFVNPAVPLISVASTSSASSSAEIRKGSSKDTGSAS
ncbi:MAG: hypothetical protein WDW38_000563 [Sanguina aurantia]